MKKSYIIDATDGFMRNTSSAKVQRSLVNLLIAFSSRPSVSLTHPEQKHLLGTVYTKCQRQRCDNSAMTLQNGAATHFQASPLMSMRTESLASSQS